MNEEGKAKNCKGQIESVVPSAILAVEHPVPRCRCLGWRGRMHNERSVLAQNTAFPVSGVVGL